MLGHGIDISHHNTKVPYVDIASERLGRTVCMVRGTYGVKPDSKLCAHFSNVRLAGFDHVGIYSFFRPSQNTFDQCTSLYSTVKKTTNYGCKSNDVAPALDIEDDPFGPVEWRTPSPLWVPLIMEVLDGFERDFSTRPWIYISERVFEMLGNPTELLEYPWWLTSIGRPVTNKYKADIRMVQHRVSSWRGLNKQPAFLPKEKLAIDQNIIVGDLPLINQQA